MCYHSPINPMVKLGRKQLVGKVTILNANMFESLVRSTSQADHMKSFQ